MYCERCKKRLGQYEGQFILYKDKEMCVCQECLYELRMINITDWDNNIVLGVKELEGSK